MDDLTVVSFWTPGPGKYREGAEALRARCQELGLRSRIRKQPDQGYISNTLRKPGYIREILEEVGGSVLWVDADGTLFSKPPAEDFKDTDFAAPACPENERKIFRVGTVFVRDTPEGRAALAAWEAAAKYDSRSKEGTDDWALQFAIEDRWPDPAGWVRTRSLDPDRYAVVLRPSQDLPEGIVTGVRLSSTPTKKKFHREVRMRRDW